MNGSQGLGGRLLVALVMLYVAVDFCDPFLPGAFNFNPDHSVVASCAGEARQAFVEETPQLDSPCAELQPVASGEQHGVRLAQNVHVTRPLAHPSRSHLDGRAAAPAASGDDH